MPRNPDPQQCRFCKRYFDPRGLEQHQHRCTKRPRWPGTKYGKYLVPMLFAISLIFFCRRAMYDAVELIAVGLVTCSEILQWSIKRLRGADRAFQEKFIPQDDFLRAVRVAETDFLGTGKVWGFSSQGGILHCEPVVTSELIWSLLTFVNFA